MTRKEALLNAIEILKERDSCEDIIQQLESIYNEYPLNKWTKESVIDSIEQYVIEHNNVFPTIKEFECRNKNLPSTTTIKRIFNTRSIEKICEKYFPHIKENYERDYVEEFKNTYLEVSKGKIIPAKRYENDKPKYAPTIMRAKEFSNCKTYDELLYYCGIKKRNKPKPILYTRPNESKDSMVLHGETLCKFSDFVDNIVQQKRKK